MRICWNLRKRDTTPRSRNIPPALNQLDTPQQVSKHDRKLQRHTAAGSGITTLASNHWVISAFFVPCAWSRQPLQLQQSLQHIKLKWVLKKKEVSSFKELFRPFFICMKCVLDLLFCSEQRSKQSRGPISPKSMVSQKMSQMISHTFFILLWSNSVMQ